MSPVPAVMLAALIGAAQGPVVLHMARRLEHVPAHEGTAPLVSLVLALAWVGLVATGGLTATTLAQGLLCSTLVTLSLTDLAERRIPDACIIACCAVRSAYLLFCAIRGVEGVAREAFASLVGAVVMGASLLMLTLVMDRILGRESMGGGDLKLFVVAGLCFGTVRAMVLVWASCLIALLGVLASRAVGLTRSTQQHHAAYRNDFAFGPAIALAFWALMLSGDAVLSIYEGLLAI